MARRRKSRKSAAPRGKGIRFGKRLYKCRAKRVNAFGRRRKATRVYCARAKKA